MKLDIIWITPDRFDQKPDKSTWIEMVRSMCNEGHTARILTSRGNEIINTENEYDQYVVTVKPWDFPYIFRISVLINILLWIKKNSTKESVIIINQDALYLVPFIKLMGIRRIFLDIRTLPVDMHRFKDHLDKLLFWTLPLKSFGRFVQGYSFITERLRQEVERDFNINAEEYVIWQSGVSTDIFYQKNNGISKDDSKFKLFYHGTVSVNRGIGLVIEAMSLLDASVSAEFIIVGTGSGMEELKELSTKLNINDKITFKGFMPYQNMAHEISQADVCICPLPNRLEWNVSSPIKVFEYMACGKPMILTPIPAHKDVLNDEPYVVWTEGYSPGDFKNAIVQSIKKLETITSVAESGTELIKTNYEWRHQAAKLVSYITNRL